MGYYAKGYDNILEKMWGQVFLALGTLSVSDNYYK